MTKHPGPTVLARPILVIVLYCALVATSCVKTPATVPLPGSPSLATIAIQLDGATEAGQCVHQFPYMQLQISGRTEDGTRAHSTTYFTKGRPEIRRGTIATSSVEVSASHGNISEHLLFVPPVNDLELLDRTIEFNARSRANPEINATLQWTPSFDCHSVVALRGRDGANGAPGGNGGHGENGPEIKIAVTYLDLKRPENAMLALAKVQSSQSGALLGYYIFSPAHGIRFDVSGGHGEAAGAPYVVSSTVGGNSGGGIYNNQPITSETTLPGGVAGQSGQSGNLHLSVDERFPGLASSVSVTRGSGGVQASQLPLSPTSISPVFAFKEEFLAGIPVKALEASVLPDGTDAPRAIEE